MSDRPCPQHAFDFESGRKRRLRGDGVSGSGQLGGGPEGGMTPRFRTPLKSRILESLELTPVGTSVIITGRIDAVFERANGLTANEGSGASMSLGDEAIG